MHGSRPLGRIRALRQSAVVRTAGCCCCDRPELRRLQYFLHSTTPTPPFSLPFPCVCCHWTAWSLPPHPAAPSSRPPDCPSKRILDGDGWAFGWGWMGPQSPSKRVLDGIAMGIWMGVSRRWRSPNSALECADSRGPPEEQRVILGRLGRFIFRNLVLRPCDHTIGAPRASSVRSGQFSSSWTKYHPKIYASDYIPSNCRR